MTKPTRPIFGRGVYHTHENAYRTILFWGLKFSGFR